MINDKTFLFQSNGSLCVMITTRSVKNDNDHIKYND